MREFIRGVEKLIDPITVGTLHFMQTFNNLLPKNIQKKLVNKSSKVTPYMGFVIEPYSCFLCYEIVDVERAKKLIPTNFKLIKCKIFDDDEPKYYVIFGCVNARTSAFMGMRVEFYVMAEDINTGLLSWIIIDYDTNTISYDKKNGLSNSNCSNSFITTDYDGILSANIIRKDNSRKLIFEVDITKGSCKKLDQRLWLEGNLSIGYGKDISDDGDIFSLRFNPEEVEAALEIPISAFNLIHNDWHKGLYKETPSKIVIFPYAQHFISDSPGHKSNIKNKEELVKAVNKIDFDKIKVFSTKSFKVMFLVGGLLSFIVSITLLVLLILK